MLEAGGKAGEERYEMIMMVVVGGRWYTYRAALYLLKRLVL